MNEAEANWGKIALPTGYIRRIVDSFLTARPSIDSIYVFGSRARGDCRENSDVDLLVVVPKYETSKMKDTMAFYEPLDWLNPFDSIPYDLILHDRDDFSRLSSIPGTVDFAAVKEGVKIYE